MYPESSIAMLGMLHGPSMVVFVMCVDCNYWPMDFEFKFC